MGAALRTATRLPSPSQPSPSSFFLPPTHKKSRGVFVSRASIRWAYSTATIATPLVQGKPSGGHGQTSAYAWQVSFPWRWGKPQPPVLTHHALRSEKWSALNPLRVSGTTIFHRTPAEDCSWLLSDGTPFPASPDGKPR